MFISLNKNILIISILIIYIFKIIDVYLSTIYMYMIITQCMYTIYTYFTKERYNSCEIV